MLAAGNAPVVLLVTTNGTGMGHLARMVALASAGLTGGTSPAAPMFEPIIVSMSSALPLVADATGLRGEYCPGPARNWMRNDQWHRYMRARLVALARETGARAVIFDGVAPYLGILDARRVLRDVPFVWSRRGLWRQGISGRALHLGRYFDLIISPGDLAGPADRGPTAGRNDAQQVAPVSLLETHPPLPRAEAAAALGLAPDRPTLLVSLGAGDLDHPGNRVGAAIRPAMDHPDWQVALVVSPISGVQVPKGLAGRVVSVRGIFPIVRYLSAFDAATSSAGYNAVHEFVLGGVPTLLVPSAKTYTDDQAGRAEYIARQGWGLRTDVDDVNGIEQGVRRLLAEDERGRIRQATSSLPAPTGAAEAAALLAGLIGARHGVGVDGPRGRTWDPYWDLFRGYRGAKALVRRGAGEDFWQWARRAALRAPREPADRPKPVMRHAGVLPDGVRRLIVTRELDDVVVHPDAVVEHVLPGTSGHYLAEREALTARTYRFAGPA